jgi:putative transposase
MVVAQLKEKGVSERRACRLVQLSRCAGRYVQREHHPELVQRITQLASENPRYGYRRIWALLRQQAICLNPKTIHRIWKQQGLQVQRSKPKRKRLQKAVYPHVAQSPNQVWSMDFVHDRLSNNSALRLLTLVDEYTRECLAIVVKRSMKAKDVRETLNQIIAERGEAPLFIRSDNGSEFIAQALQIWLRQMGIVSTFIEPGSPWQNGKSESFNGKLRDECLNMNLFNTLFEAKVILRQWQTHYNHRRPHSALNYLTPIQFAAQHLPKATRAANEGETNELSPASRPRRFLADGFHVTVEPQTSTSAWY